MELLLECGANVNAVDNQRNTALHLCSKAIRNLELNQHRDSMKQIAVLLLKNEAHADIANIAGYKASESLPSTMEMNMLNFVGLKCLAATAVMKYEIAYAERIPAELEYFVQMHGIQ